MSPHSMEPQSFIQLLPIEIIENIFARLDADELLRNVRLVCRRFCSILSDDVFWKKHFLTRLNIHLVNSDHQYPLLEHYGLGKMTWKCSLDLEWRDIAVQSAIEQKKWVPNRPVLIRREIKPHVCSIDAVHLIDGAETCVSGSRDGLIALWDVEKVENLACYEKAHNGWVWDLTSYEKGKFFSCGWDAYMYNWSLTPTGFQRLAEYRIGKPALSIACKYGLVALGSTGGIVLIDPRIESMNSKFQLTQQKNASAIIDLEIQDNALISISEDKKMGVYDLRMKKIIKENKVSLDDSFPRSIGIKGNVVYVGDSKGNIHLYDAYNHYDNFQVISLGCQVRQITGVIPGYGTLCVGSTDKALRFVLPTKPHQVLKEYQFLGEVISVDKKKNVIAIGATDNSVSFIIGNQ